MPKSRRSITLTALTAKPDSVESQIGTYFLSKFDAQGTAANKAAYEGGLYNEDAELTIAGTTTNIWTANPGWITPAGDNYISLAGASAGSTADTGDAFWSKLRLDSAYAYHGILHVFDAFYTTNPTAEEKIYGSGDPNSAIGGGWQISLNTGGSLIAEYKKGSGTSKGVNTSLPKNARVSVLTYYDYTNKRVNLIINGGATTQGPLWDTVVLDLARSSNRSHGLLGGGNSPTPASSLINQNGSGMRVKREFILRPTTDISSSLTAIAAGFYDNEGVLPQALVDEGVIGG